MTAANEANDANETNHANQANEDDLSAMAPGMVMMSASYLMRSALDLGLPDAVGQGPVAVPELAEQVGAEPAALRRLLRALVRVGMFRPVGEDAYAGTRMSALWRTDSASTGYADFANIPWMWQLWENLTPAVRTGRTQFPDLFGKNLFDYLSEDDPESAERFNVAMTRGLGVTNEAIAEALDLSGVSKLVDVGGGQGTMLRSLLRANPHVRGVLFDIPAALSDVDEQLRVELADRSEVVSGDAMVSVPAADSYVFRTILHNWDDESCVRMLRSCAEAGGSGARVHVVEVLVPERGEVSEFAAMMDLQMFLLFGSRERTESEYAELFRRAGLSLVGSRPTSSQFSIVEARVD